MMALQGINHYFFLERFFRYQTTGGITGRINHLNPHWNEENINPDERFQKAMELVGGDFVEALQYLYNVWWPARQIVEQAIENRHKVGIESLLTSYIFRLIRLVVSF